MKCNFEIDGYTMESHYILRNEKKEVFKISKKENTKNVIFGIFKSFNFKKINVYYYNENNLYIDFVINFEELEKIKDYKIVFASQDEEEKNTLNVQIERI